MYLILILYTDTYKKHLLKLIEDFFTVTLPSLTHISPRQRYFLRLLSLLPNLEKFSLCSVKRLAFIGFRHYIASQHHYA